MVDWIIKAERLGKRFRISHEPRERYRTMRDAVSEGVRGLFRRGERTRTPATEDFWALRGASFEVRSGEVLGVIGRNGAGKSTLLKVLSRITEPSEGRVTLRGRVASLLEVGTGFHPELTGRENVFLNGAILGMSRREIRAKFDEIVAFADVERFLDTPVKRYSSGMYVRLAFAVAAHLEPEILVVDEVLAVGDAAFQRKCIGKMSEVGRSGRTVLFVSHNMAAVRLLCQRGIVLERGQVTHDGTIESAVAAYLSKGEAECDASWRRSVDSKAPIYFESVEARLEGAQPAHRLSLRLHLRSRGPHKPAFLAADIHDGLGGTIMQAEPTSLGFLAANRSLHDVTVHIDLPPMVPGAYPVSLWVGSHNTETYDWARSCVRFEITQSPSPGRTFPYTPDHGFIVPTATITYERAEHQGDQQ